MAAETMIFSMIALVALVAIVARAAGLLDHFLMEGAAARLASQAKKTPHQRGFLTVIRVDP